MGLDPKEVRDLIVRPVLEALDLPSPDAAERLLMGTAAQESGFGHLKQLGGGPALGLWQMEPTTFNDLWYRYLGINQPTLQEKCRKLALHGNYRELPGNLYFSAAMCRVLYYSKPFPLDNNAPLTELARVWKKYYNTPEGAGTEAQFIANYKRLVAPIYK